MQIFKRFTGQVILFSVLFLCLTACTVKTKMNPIRNETRSNKQVDSSKSALGGIDKNIRSIFQDRQGNYWFGTNSAGVFRYDGEKLTQFTAKDGLSDNQVIHIQEDDLGNIWFGTGGFSVSKFDGEKFTTLSDDVNLTNGTVENWKSDKTDLWFFAGGGVYRYSKSLLDYLPFDSSPSNSPFSLSRYGVYCILKDKNGNVWMGTQAEGVCRYDGKRLSWFKEKGLSGPAVLGLFEDSKGNLWFGNNGAGLFRFDGNTLRNITDELGLNNPEFRLTGNPGLGTLARVYSINEDNIGHIWIGTVDAGVWEYDGSKMINYTIKNGLPSDAVNTIYKDNKGELWFGTDENGVCKFNGTKFIEI